MPDAVNLTLPWPPSVNGYWRNIVVGRRPRTLLSAKGREYREAVIAAVMEQGSPTIDGKRLHAEIKLYPPDRRKRDCDNSLKGLLDGMGHAGVYGDDSQLKRLDVEMRDTEEDLALHRGVVFVTITSSGKGE